MHVLILGAAGMVGRKLTERLLRDGRLGNREISGMTLQDVVAPEKDNNFEVSGVRDVIAAAEPVYKKLNASDKLKAVYPDAGHDFPTEGRKAAYEFIDKQLKK